MLTFRYLDYNLFFRFFDTFSGAGFESIDHNNPLRKG